MLWALFALAVMEAGAVHLFVALRWPAIGWPLTVLSIATAVWLVFWIRSWARLPHQLEGDALVLHMGSMRSAKLPLYDIAAVEPVTSDALNDRATINLVPIAYPNRLILLARPHGRRRATRYAIRLDEPDKFDAAMAAAGVAVA